MKSKEGRIIFASKNRYTILNTENTEHMAVLKGNLEGLPAVGDMVRYAEQPDGLCVIESINPRKSVIARKSSGRSFSEAVIAANIDIMLIVTALDENFSLRRIERFLVLAKSGGVQPVVLLTKADICDPLDMAIRMMETEEVASGGAVITVSSVTGEGIAELLDIVSGDVTVCAVGLSGAGKSTLLNRLAEGDISKTGDVREHDSKGKHTTTSRQMFRLPSGALFVDTPGIREVGLTGDESALEDVFDDIASYAVDCFFNDCTHMHEPSCAVKKAVENGDISPERFESYKKLKIENENYRMRTEAPQEKKRADKRLSRLVKSENRRKMK